MPIGRDILEHISLGQTAVLAGGGDGFGIKIMLINQTAHGRRQRIVGGQGRCCGRRGGCFCRCRSCSGSSFGGFFLGFLGFGRLGFWGRCFGGSRTRGAFCQQGKDCAHFHISAFFRNDLGEGARGR